MTIWPWLVAASFALFGWAILQFYEANTGFSSLIMIGDALNDRKVSALREVPHYVYDHSYGYDGAYYVQLALYPTLNNPELRDRDGKPGAIDNLPYRARRMLFSWAAWLLGLGRPAWIVQAHALLNVGCWFALAFLLLRWFPPTGFQNFVRWFGILFCQGVAMSVRLSLVDLPTLLLIVWAVRWIEEGRPRVGGSVLALAGLGKETSLLASSALAGDVSWRAPRSWLKFGGRVALIVLPLVAWMIYIRTKFGQTGDAGFNNFTLPFAGLVEKWSVVLRESVMESSGYVQIGALFAIVAATVQFGFIVTRWWPREVWWRVGAAYAGLMMMLSTPVWEGYPGAFGRVLLPMTMAFNVLVPRTRAWLPVLLAGNIAVLASWWEFTPPGRDFFKLEGPSDVRSQLEIFSDSGWYGAENAGRTRWRWTFGPARLVIRNASGGPLAVTVHGQMSAAEEQAARIDLNAQGVWSGETQRQRSRFEFNAVLPAGESHLEFTGAKPARVVGTDPRELALCVFDLEIVVRRPPAQP